MNFSNNLVKYTTIFVVMGITYFLLSTYVLYGWPITFGLIYLAIYIYTFVLFGRSERAIRQDIFPFAAAFKSLMVIMVVSSISTLLFQFIWANLIHTDLPQLVLERTIDATTKTMESFGTPDDVIEDTISKLDDSILGQFTVSGLITSCFWAFFASAVLSAIIALFIRKEETFA